MKLLSGNEAIARGAYEAGVRAACAYPGTPSTEILENLAKYDEVYCEWAPNEKVAVEVAQGACFAGARTIAAMKHVGLNVAADPMFSLAYIGVNGGFIIVSADDPGMHSSQNEQDNRSYAKLMKIGLLEPSDSQEAKNFVINGFDISEKFDLPIMLRTTTRISHSKGLVSLGERREIPLRSYQKDITKYVIIPAHARKMKTSLEERLRRLADFAETFPGNRIEGTGNEFAVITSGIAYQYAKEALGDKATYLKLSLTFPFPEKLVRTFVNSYRQVYVIEEGEPFLEEQIKSLGLTVVGKDILPRSGELSPAIIRHALLGESISIGSGLANLPARPPVLCPGCPHRSVFYAINRMQAIVTGDIGCYSLGVMPPLSSIETCVCMGASIGNALGLSKMLPDRKVIATVGDSTFIHSGITGLIDVVYNQGAVTVVILDNSITAMTGHQHNPATGFNIKNQPTNKLDLENIVRACGVKNIWQVNSYDLNEVTTALTEATSCGQPAVIIAKQPCIFLDQEKNYDAYEITAQCRKCKKCISLGCPAITVQNEKIVISAELCRSCGVCAQICKFGAIRKVGSAHE